MKSLKFGDRVMNIAASEKNPIKYGRFVRKGNMPRGRINSGAYIEYISDDGSFHKTPPDNIIKVEDEEKYERI